MQRQNVQKMNTGVFSEASEGTKDREQLSYVPVEITPGTPPTMKMHKRWDYLEEYINFWKDGVKFKIKAVALLAFGLLTLTTFPPGALLMIALAARYQDLSWLDDYITQKFGKQRTLVLID